MFNITEEQRKQLLQHIAMLASLKNIQEKKDDGGKKDVPKVSG